MPARWPGHHPGRTVPAGSHIVDPQPHEVIFDVCAAPGGKTTHLATLGSPSCVVYGGDIHEHKLKLIDYNAQKLGLKNVRTLFQNACTIGQKYGGRADRVLIDAPCSGLGVLRHKIDLRWRKQLSDLRTCRPCSGAFWKVLPSV